MQGVNEERLDQLRVADWGDDVEQRRARDDDAPFRDRPEVAPETTEGHPLQGVAANLTEPARRRAAPGSRTPGLDGANAHHLASQRARRAAVAAATDTWSPPYPASVRALSIPSARRGPAKVATTVCGATAVGDAAAGSCATLPRTGRTHHHP